ncbi:MULTISPECIES: hypothetical protein [unclassified Mycolicibacterium]|uniref:hypothetical protein n=1 Tax=unclassified Mycolicibacterium TaxID=2636767 RepID=UPI001BB30DA8|nr:MULTISPECIES: hypothetical protein [unclassified Mycolicibacterium]
MVIVLDEHPMLSARVALVTATCRPVAWSAYSAIAAATRSTVSAVIEQPKRVAAALITSADAHALSALSHAALLVHIGVIAGVWPARSIQVRRRRFACRLWTYAGARTGAVASAGLGLAGEALRGRLLVRSAARVAALNLGLSEGDETPLAPSRP